MSIAGINQAKLAQSAELARQIAEFEARGGRIEYVPIISRSKERYQGYNNSQVEAIADPAKQRVAAENKAKRGKRRGPVTARIEAKYGRPALEVVKEIVTRCGSYKAAAREIGCGPAALIAIWGGYETYQMHEINGVRDTVEGHCRRRSFHSAAVCRRLARGETLRQALDIDPVESGRVRRRRNK